MAKLPSVSTRDVVRALVKVGFAVIAGRGKGSHTLSVSSGSSHGNHRSGDE